MNRTLRIAAPVGLAVVVAGVLLGVFLTGDDPEPPAPSDQVASAPETATGDEEAVSPADEVVEAVPDAETTATTVDEVMEAPATEKAAETTLDTEATVEERVEGSQTQEIVEQAQQALETAGDAEPEITVEELAAATDAADDIKDLADEPPVDPSTVVENVEDAVRTERPDVVEPDTVLSEATPGDDQSLPEAEDPVDDITARTDQEGDPAAPEEEVAPPSFDVVRINPRGDAVIAGRAEPGAEVTIRDGDVDIGTVTADDRGEWVLLPDAPLEGGDRELSIVETLPEGGQIESESVVVLSVPERDDGTAEDEAALAVLVPRDGEGASRVLQRPPEAAESFGVDRADHMTDDQLIASGRAAPGGLVEIFVDGAAVGTA
ncbi:MAG: hypothetical protein MI755_09060, partial [Sphingomonadales bacterium]|nr:hypothetical protein [Sphingomonadales bacterium]